MRVCADLRLGGVLIHRDLSAHYHTKKPDDPGGCGVCCLNRNISPREHDATYQGQRSSAVVLPSVFLGKTNHRTTPLHDRDDYDDDGAVPLEQFPLR